MEMVERIEFLAERVRKGEFKVEEINITQPVVDDLEAGVQGINTKKPGRDIYWVIHLRQETF